MGAQSQSDELRLLRVFQRVQEVVINVFPRDLKFHALQRNHRHAQSIKTGHSKNQINHHPTRDQARARFNPPGKSGSAWSCHHERNHHKSMPRPQHYCPAINRFLVSCLYHEAKAQKKPMTVLTNQLLETALAGSESWRKAQEAFKAEHKTE